MVKLTPSSRLSVAECYVDELFRIEILSFLLINALVFSFMEHFWNFTFSRKKWLTLFLNILMSSYYLFYVLVYVSECFAYMYACHMHALSKKARRGSQIPLD